MASQTVESAPMDGAGRLSPVLPEERVQTIDVLKGAALFGVLIANTLASFNGFSFLPSEARMAVLQAWSADGVTLSLSKLLVSGKAMSALAILFGVGFALQLGRADVQEVPVVAPFVRKMSLLFLLGTVHILLVWYGDILTAYGVGGLLLLLFRKRQQRTLLLWAGGLVVLTMLVFGAIPLVSSLVSAPDIAQQLKERAEEQSNSHERLLALQRGGYLDRVRVNWEETKEYLPMFGFQVAYLVAMFLAGLWLGRARVLQQVDRYRGLLRRCARWGFAIGLPVSAAGVVLDRLFPPDAVPERAWLPLVWGFTAVGGMIPMTIAYLSGIALCLERPRWQRMLRPLAAVGRMPLTTYLCQSLLCIAIFGAGRLIGRTGVAASLAICIAVYAVQIAFAVGWLARYRFGPVEWSLRALAYGRGQLQRRQPLPAAVEVRRAA